MQPGCPSRYSDTFAHLHALSDSNASPHVYAVSNPDHGADCNPYSYARADCYPYTGTYACSHSKAYPGTDRDAYTDHGTDCNT
ncbi:MAG: hypothetical protein F4X65_10455 [Chloroflexi bacterium]|nr:hypothetical protein [Chloroflexota bacterium]